MNTINATKNAISECQIDDVGVVARGLNAKVAASQNPKKIQSTTGIVYVIFLVF